VEYSSSTGNFTQVAHDLLEKISVDKDSRMTYTADHHTFNYVVRKELIYLCLADEEFGRAVPFAFLDKVATQFEMEFGNRARDSKVSYSLNADFSPVLKREMETFSTEGSSKIQNVQEDLDRVKGVMQENINMVLERGEKLDHLVVQSENLMDTSNSFRSGATRLKDQMWWNNFKIKAAAGIIAFIVFFIIVANACGGMKFPDC